MTSAYGTNLGDLLKNIKFVTIKMAEQVGYTVDPRVDALIVKVDYLAGELNKQGSTIENLVTQLLSIQHELGNLADELSQLDTSLRGEIQALTLIVNANTTAISNHDTAIYNLQQDVALLKSRTATLESAVAALADIPYATRGVISRDPHLHFTSSEVDPSSNIHNMFDDTESVTKFIGNYAMVEFKLPYRFRLKYIYISCGTALTGSTQVIITHVDPDNNTTSNLQSFTNSTGFKNDYYKITNRASKTTHWWQVHIFNFNGNGFIDISHLQFFPEAEEVQLLNLH